MKFLNLGLFHIKKLKTASRVPHAIKAKRAIDDIKMIFGSISLPNRILLKDYSLRS